MRREGGFTLVEIIVVLVILAIISSILVPTLTGYMDKSNENACLATRRQLLSLYEGYQLFYPSAYDLDDINEVLDSDALNSEFQTFYEDYKDGYACPSGGEYVYEVGNSTRIPSIQCTKHGGAKYRITLKKDDIESSTKEFFNGVTAFYSSYETLYPGYMPSTGTMLYVSNINGTLPETKVNPSTLEVLPGATLTRNEKDLLFWKRFFAYVGDDAFSEAVSAYSNGDTSAETKVCDIKILMNTDPVTNVSSKEIIGLYYKVTGKNNTAEAIYWADGTTERCHYSRSVHTFKFGNNSRGFSLSYP